MTIDLKIRAPGDLVAFLQLREQKRPNLRKCCVWSNMHMPKVSIERHVQLFERANIRRRLGQFNSREHRGIGQVNPVVDSLGLDVTSMDISPHSVHEAFARSRHVSVVDCAAVSKQRDTKCLARDFNIHVNRIIEPNVAFAGGIATRCMLPTKVTRQGKTCHSPRMKVFVHSGKPGSRRFVKPAFSESREASNIRKPAARTPGRRGVKQ